MQKHYIINKKIKFYPQTGTLESLENGQKCIQINFSVSCCLQILIERKGHIISQKEMMEEVWHKMGLHVSSNTYYQNIYLLRHGLKKAGIEQNAVITVPRMGVTLNFEIIIDCVSESSSYFGKNKISEISNDGLANTISLIDDHGKMTNIASKSICKNNLLFSLLLKINKKSAKKNFLYLNNNTFARHCFSYL